MPRTKQTYTVVYLHVEGNFPGFKEGLSMDEAASEIAKENGSAILFKGDPVEFHYSTDPWVTIGAPKKKVGRPRKAKATATHKAAHATKLPVLKLDGTPRRKPGRKPKNGATAKQESAAA